MSIYSYPEADIEILPIDEAFKTQYVQPPGIIPDPWPPRQAQYLQVYLKEIGCTTVLVEQHYIDRIFMHDVAVYYVRSLRSYQSFTRRLHFFRQPFNVDDWRAMLSRAARGEHKTIETELQQSYLGFSVVRPLPGSPVGRTVLPAKQTRPLTGTESIFATVRGHTVHFGGFALRIEGVPFQSQDQGVSACATTALWSALDCVAAAEEITVSSPASITEAATRYPLQEGRTFPTEGLTVRQICEATRAAGFSPLVIHGKSFADDALQIFSYARSGFAPVLALVPTQDGEPGHAVCGVGLRIGLTKAQTDPTLKFREASTALQGVYIHDDRLGPYAFAELSPFTDKNGKIRTRVAIEWPDAQPDESWLLHAIVVPVPQKLRLTLARLRKLGLLVAQVIGDAFADPQTTLDCRYDLSRNYIRRAYEFGLSDDGLYRLICQTALSRFVGLIQISGPQGPILDVVVDTTEVNSEASVLACIKRAAFPAAEDTIFQVIAKHVGATPIA